MRADASVYTLRPGKMSIILQTKFEIRFRDRKLLYYDSNSTNYVPKGHINKKTYQVADHEP